MPKLPSSPLSIVPDLMISLGLSDRHQAASDTKDPHTTLISPEKSPSPSLPVPAPQTETASTKSTGETDNLPMADSSIGLAAANNGESEQENISLKQKTPIQPDQDVPSPPSHADVADTTQTPQAPDEESQKLQNLRESGMISQSSFPLSSTPSEAKTDGPRSGATSRSVQKELSPSTSNKDIRGSLSNSVEGYQKPEDLPVSKASTESLLPLSSIANTDEVNSPGDEDAPDATESPQTRKSLVTSPEEKADIDLDASSNVREEGIRPNSDESQQETSHQDDLPTTEENLRPFLTPSSPIKTESPKTADAFSPTTEEAPRETATPSSPTESKPPKTADVFWPKTPESPGTARKLTPLKTFGFSSDTETQSPLKTTGTPRTADKPSSSEAHRPSISAEKPLWPKTTRNSSTSSPQALGNTTNPDRGSPLQIAESVKFANMPASPRQEGSRKDSDIGSLPKAVEGWNDSDVSSSLKAIESSNIPSSLPKPESSNDAYLSFLGSFNHKAVPENLYAAPEEGVESPHTSSSLPTSGPLKDRDVSFRRPSDQRANPQRSYAAPETEKNQEQPESEIRSILVELPQAGAKGQELPIPKIFIERASDVSDEDDPRSAPKSPTVGHWRKSGGMVQAATRVPSQGTSVLLYPSASGLRGPALPQIAENAEAPETPKILKRKLYLRKARNLAARNILLKAALGRQLADVTKPVLRRLAHGEAYSSDASEQQQVQVQVKVTKNAS